MAAALGAGDGADEDPKTKPFGIVLNGSGASPLKLNDPLNDPLGFFAEPFGLHNKWHRRTVVPRQTLGTKQRRNQTQTKPSI